MMVDKTGVGPEGGGDVAEAEGTNECEGEEEGEAEEEEEEVDDEEAHEGNDQGQGEKTSPGSRDKSAVTVAAERNVRRRSCPTEWLEEASGTQSNQRWMKLRTTVQLSSAITSTIQKKPTLKREDSFLKKFSTRHNLPENQETIDTGDEGGSGGSEGAVENSWRRRRRHNKPMVPSTVVNPDENFYYYWLMLMTVCVLYNFWALIVRESFPELQMLILPIWIFCDIFTDIAFLLDVVVQFRTGYLEQGLMVYNSKKLAQHYMRSTNFMLDIGALLPLDLLQFNVGFHPMLRFPKYLKVYRASEYYYMVESRTVYPNLWRVVNLIHILLILAHWFGCFYFLLSQAESFQGDWVYPYRPGEYSTLARKYLASLYWSTLTLTTIGDLPTPETNSDKRGKDGPQSLPRRGHKSRLLQFKSNKGFIFTIVSYLIGVFIFATIVGQVGNVITNRNANRLEFERLLDGAKTYMRHHKVPGEMKRRVLRWYDYSWSRGRIQGGGDINMALGLLPDKLKTELALHVNLSVLKKVTIFQECQPEFLHDLVLKMKAYIFTPGDLICRKGEVAREMFIIADGILEVQSERGRVLTTMKAGDFFGEIGILNLDGLNRRTADVRSVGYSELFSLSREDVLGALKDYPEAQEILQTLGRKRLLEARNMNRNYKNGSESKKRGSQGSSENIEQKTGKKLVDKIRSDVKGLTSVLKKRGGRSREEYVELQPLTKDDRYRREGKGILRRMPRVASDDTSPEEELEPSLIQRIKLLKEKQDREAAEQSKAAEEHEVIGAGLPLLTRLLLLKQREDATRDANIVRTTADQTAQVLATVSTQLQSPTPSTSKSGAGVTWIDEFPRVDSKEGESAGDRDGTSIKEPSEIEVPRPHKIQTKKFQNLMKRAGVGSKVLDKTESVGRKAESLQSADLVREGATEIKGEENPAESKRLSPSSVPSDEMERAPSKLLQEKTTSPPHNSLRLEPSKSTSVSDINATGETNFLEKEGSSSINSGTLAQVLNSAQNISFSEGNDSEACSVDSNKHTVTINIEVPGKLDGSDRKIGKTTQSSLRHNIGSKIYRSIDDLSPEYSSLSFVKQMRILNERHKQEEYEKKSAARSSSLDSSHSSRKKEFKGQLTRSLSEAIEVEVVIHNQSLQTQTVAAQKNESESGNFDPVSSPPSLGSPESNETMERRHLKSILKKLSFTSVSSNDSSPGRPGLSSSPAELKKLMRAQTVEGYAARHSKLTKSVTFDHDTLQSPPGHTSSEPTPPVLPLQPNLESQSQPRQNLHRPGSVLLPYQSNFDKKFYGELFCGIKSTLISHLDSIEDDFYERYYDIEMEVTKRDDIIEQLQQRIQELEAEREYDSEDFPDAPFSRGDSVDTVMWSRGHRSEPYRPESIFIDIDSDTNTSASDEMNPTDWEARMLAEVMDMQESPSTSTSQSRSFDGDNYSGNSSKKKTLKKRSYSVDSAGVSNEENSRPKKKGSSASFDIPPK